MTRALRRGLLALALGVILVEVSGCAGRKVYGEGVARIEAVPGEIFIIELEANPTTGFAWSVRGRLVYEVVALLGSDYQAAPTTVVGSGGLQRITFRAAGRGTTTITLDYRRQWDETTTPAKSESFTLVVR